MPHTVKTDFGTFQATDDYRTEATPFGNLSAMLSAAIDITFLPADGTPAASEVIGLIQATQFTRPGVPLDEQYQDEPLLLERIKASAHGWYIDQYSWVMNGLRISEEDARQVEGKKQLELITQTNPVYNAMNTEQGKLAQTLQQNVGANSSGRVYYPDTKTPARLVDHPGRMLLASEDQTYRQEFETAAVTLTGNPIYLGSVRWGYTARRVGTSAVYEHAVLPFELAAPGRPTDTFFEAAPPWNGQMLPDFATGNNVARVAVPL